MRRISVAGHFGELLQGRIGADLALVTLPCPELRLDLQRMPGRFGLFQPGGRVLRLSDAARMLRGLGRRVTGAHVLHGAMPPGGGAGSSTAALVALARAAGESCPLRIARAALAVEGASDPLMYLAPERMLWASRKAQVLADLPPLPALELVGGFYGPPRRTDPADLDFPDIADLVAAWPAACTSPEAVARLASQSALRCLALRGPAADPTPALATSWGALGFSIAHTGSARALIYAAGRAPAGLEAGLRAAGFTGVLRFRIGGRG